MSRVIKGIIGIGLAIVGVATGNFQLIALGVTMVGSALLEPSNKTGSQDRNAAAAQLQLGEVPRQAVFGRAAVAGSLVDAFNYGGQYGTDWEVLVIAVADHRCDALEGFYVNDTYVAFAGDGAVAGYNGQLMVYWRDGQWSQSVPSILTTNGPGWTANDRGRGVAWVTVAYKADAADATSPVWPGGRPSFRWVVRGMRCYDPRLDSTVGGSGSHRRSDPSTWTWSENPIVCRYNWVRGIYAGDLVAQPGMLLIGRGLSEIEAPPANVFARANLCDEVVDGEARYRIGGLVDAAETYLSVEEDIAAACAGIIVQREGSVEIDPGEAKAVVASFTDDDLLVGSKVRWSSFLGAGDEAWINTAVAKFTDPAQAWQERSAPVRRDLADVAADGAPREATLRLTMVSWVKQAGRVAEIVRRFGRLWGRATVTLPPRFAALEEGDWVQWTSARHFGGATKTFRIEAWGSDEKWHHQLTLREIGASVFTDTALPSDGAVANQQAVPGSIAAPGAAAWALAAGTLAGTGVKLPALVVTGAIDQAAAKLVKLEYVQSTTAPTGSTVWTDAGLFPPDMKRQEFPVAPGGTFYVAVSYQIDGVTGPRRVLGPVTVGSVAYADGVAIESLKPAAAGATVGATAGTNLYRADGTTVLSQAEVRTAEGISAGFTGQGALAVLNAVDLSTGQVTGKSLANLDATANTKLGTIESYATSGDTFIVNGPLANSGAGWSTFGSITLTTADGIAVWAMDNGAYAYVNANAQTPVRGGKFFVEAYGKYDGDRTTRLLRLVALARNAAGTVVYNQTLSPVSAPTTTMDKLRWELDLPATTATLQLQVLATVAGGTTGKMYIGAFRAGYTQIGADLTQSTLDAQAISAGATAGDTLIVDAGLKNAAVLWPITAGSNVAFVAAAGTEDAYFKVDGNPGGTNYVYNVSSSFTSALAVVPEGATVFFSLLARTDGARTVRVYARAWKENGTAASPSTPISQSVSSAGAWTELTGNFAMPAGYRYLQIWIELPGSATGTYTHVKGLRAALTQRAATVGAVAGTNLYRTDGTTVLSQADVRTVEGVSAGFTGQGALASLNAVDLSTGQVTGKSLANLDATANTKLGGIAAGATVGAVAGTNLYRTDGTTVMSQAEVRTAEGVASGFTGQGALASLNSVDLATTQVTGKSLANLDATASTKLGGIAAGATVGAVAGTNLYRTDGTTVMSQAEVRTAEGVASGFTGQGALASLNAVDLATTQVTGKSLANLDATANTKLSGIAAGATVGSVAGTNLYRTDGTTVMSQAEVRTAEGVASGFTGQGALASLNAVDLATTQVTGKSLANLDAMANTKLGGIAAGATVGSVAGTNLYRTDGTTVMSQAEVRTAEGVASGFTGQGALASLNAVDLATTQVTGKSLANLDATANTKLGGIAAGATVGSVAGTNLYRTDGTTVMSQAEVRTAEGVASGFTGQGALASLNSVDLSTGQVTGKSLANLDSTANTKLAGIEAGADVTANKQVSLTDVAPFTIQANSASVTTTTLPVTRAVSVLVGATAQTSGVTVGTVTTSPSAAITATASVASGVVTVSVSKADASGTVTVPITYGGLTYNKIIAVNRTVAAPVAGGASGSTSFVDGVWDPITTTSDVQVTDTGAKVKSDASGQLAWSFSASYDGTGAATVTAQYSADGSSWTNFATGTTGTIAVAGAEPNQGYVANSGLKTGLTANTDYFVRAVARRSTTSGTLSWASPNFTVNQP